MSQQKNRPFVGLTGQKQHSLLTLQQHLNELVMGIGKIYQILHRVIGLFDACKIQECGHEDVYYAHLSGYSHAVELTSLFELDQDELNRSSTSSLFRIKENDDSSLRLRRCFQLATLRLRNGKRITRRQRMVLEVIKAHSKATGALQIENYLRFIEDSIENTLQEMNGNAPPQQQEGSIPLPDDSNEIERLIDASFATTPAPSSPREAQRSTAETGEFEPDVMNFFRQKPSR